MGILAPMLSSAWEPVLEEPVLVSTIMVRALSISRTEEVNNDDMISSREWICLQRLEAVLYMLNSTCDADFLTGSWACR